MIEFPSKANATPALAELGSVLFLSETSTVPTIHETRANAILRNPGIRLLAVILLVLTALAVLLWRPWAAARQSNNNSAVATPVSTPDPKATSSRARQYRRSADSAGNPRQFRDTNYGCEDPDQEPRRNPREPLLQSACRIIVYEASKRPLGSSAVASCAEPGQHHQRPQTTGCGEQ